jgi:hypothetical protein
MKSEIRHSDGHPPGKRIFLGVTEVRMTGSTKRLSALAGVFLLAGTSCTGQMSGGAGASPGTGGSPGGLGGGGSIAISGTGATGTGAGGAVGAGGGTATPVACAPLAPISRRLWRLSSQQYANAARDLLALTAPVLVSSTADGSSAYALVNDVSLAVNDQLLFNGFYQTAENVITQITPRLAQITACTPGEVLTACATRFAQTFGAKVFRRPIAAAEVTDLMKVYTAGAATDFNTGVGMMIEALLLSPSFLYRTELGSSTLTGTTYSDTTLTPYEVATQLGFLFLDSTPDATLLTAAAAPGDAGLGTPAGIMAQVTRMLALPAVKTNLTGVISNWFSLGQLSDKANKVPSFLTGLPTASQDQTVLVGDLLASAQQFIADTLWTNPAGKLTDLLTSQKVFVNQRLATLYGLPPVTGTGFVAATWPTTQARIGLLSQPSFLWAISGADTTSIVLRGKFIHDDVICQDPLPPKIAFDDPALAAILAMGDSEETKSDVRLSQSFCKGCHANMDPYSRVLENFDAIGKYRTVDEAGRPVNSTASLLPPNPLAPATLSGSADLGQLLSSSKLFAGCGVQKMASYATGAVIRTYNTCELNDLRAKLDQSNGTVTSLFSQLAAASFVRARAGGVQ